MRLSAINRVARDFIVMDLHLWLTFFAASWAISLSPGAGAVAAMGAGLQFGARGTAPMVAGLVLGITSQVLVVGVGLGALIAASAWAFRAVQIAGVVYLVWLGIQQWRAPATALHVPADGSGVAGPGVGPAGNAGQTVPVLMLVRRGWMVNGLNPKGTVFLLAVVPQFLDLAAPLGLQYAVIGATLALTDSVVMSGYALLAVRVLRQMRSARQVLWLQRVFGTLFIAAGALLATFRRA